MNLINRKIRIALVAGAVVILGGGFILLPRLFPGKKEIAGSKSCAVVQKGDLDIVLSVKGRLKPLKSTMVNTSQPGKVIYLIAEGTYVKAGELLVSMEKTDLEKAAIDAKYKYEQEILNEDKNRSAAEKNIALMEIKLKDARENLRTVIPDVIAGKKTPADLKLAKYTLKEAEINCRLAKSDFEQYQKEGSAGLRQARTNYEKARKSLSDADILSPAPGLVVFEDFRKPSGWGKILLGDTVWQNQSIISLPDLSKMVSIAEVSEVDLAKVEIGQSCSVRIDAYPDKQYSGTVTKKGNVVKDSVFVPGVKICEVEVLIDGEHTYLRPGMTSSVDINIETLKNVNYAPIFSVFEYDHKYYCYLAVGTSYVKKEVKLGQSTNRDVVISSGLSAGDRVALFDPTLTAAK